MAKEFVGRPEPFTWRKWRLELDREHDRAPYAWRFEDEEAYVVVSLEESGRYEALVDIAHSVEGTGAGDSARAALDAALLSIHTKATEIITEVVKVFAVPRQG